GLSFVVSTSDVTGSESMCFPTYAGFPADISPGDEILIDDGRVRLRAVEVDETDVTARVELPGVVSDHKGINLPGVKMSVPAMTDKDAEDLGWALRTGADFIALSFVRSGTDCDGVRRIMPEA